MNDLLRCLKAAAEAFATEAGRLLEGGAPAPVDPAVPAEDVLQIECPFCWSAVEKTPGGNSWYRCEKGHSFDRAAPAAPPSEE